MKWRIHVVEDNILSVPTTTDNTVVEELTFELMRKEFQCAQFEVQIYGDTIQQQFMDDGVKLTQSPPCE